MTEDSQGTLTVTGVSGQTAVLLWIWKKLIRARAGMMSCFSPVEQRLFFLGYPHAPDHPLPCFPFQSLFNYVISHHELLKRTQGTPQLDTVVTPEHLLGNSGFLCIKLAEVVLPPWQHLWWEERQLWSTTTSPALTLPMLQNASWQLPCWVLVHFFPPCPISRFFKRTVWE